MDNRIPIVWGLDKKYVLQAFVVMHSILKNSNENFTFILITADDIAITVSEMESSLQKEYRNFELKIITINQDIFAEVRIFSNHLSGATYFRLLIPELLKEYSKCIYLDCDVIVNGNLKEMYDISIEEYYIAGVKDCHIIQDTEREYEHQKLMGIPSRKNYINAGVMLMNLDKLRNDRMVGKFLEQAKRENWNEDQDVLNVCCYNAIKVLPLKYNLFQFYLGGRIKNLFGIGYTEQDFAFDWNQPYILHTGGMYKAWLDIRYEGAKKWWKLAEIFANTEAYSEQKKKYEQHVMEEYDFEFILNKCKKAEAIVIWGYTQNGKSLYDVLNANGINNVLAFADNNKLLWGCDFKGVFVREMSEVMAQYTNITWIVASVRAYNEIKEQLIQSGEKENQIFHFINNKPWHYYLSLSQDYYEREIMDICRKEYVKEISDIRVREKHIWEIINNPQQHKAEYRYLYHKYRFDLWLKSQVL